MVLLWIRLSVTFGYPAAYTGLPRMRMYEKISQFKEGTSHSTPTQDYDETANIKWDSSTRPYTSLLSSLVAAGERQADTPRKTSPHYINEAFDRRPQTESNDTRIISIVRVSSTSVVKPKRLERVTQSVSESRNYFNTIKLGSGINDEPTYYDAMKKIPNNTTTTTTMATTTTTIINETKLEDLVTPFISLLRKNRFDVYENDPRETSASSTSANYIGDAVVSTIRLFPEKSVNTVYRRGEEDSPSRYAFHRQSKSFNDTNNDSTEMATEQYTDAFVTETDERKDQLSSSSSSIFSSSSNVYFHLYDERDYTAGQRAGGGGGGGGGGTYEDTERSYEPSEEVYGEPEKVYGEPEKVYGEPEKIYGEPEKVYGESESAGLHSGSSVEQAADGETEKTYELEDEKYKSETMHDDPETEFVKQENHFGLGLPESSENAANSYSLFTTRVNDKKSSFIVDNGTHRKYRVEEKTPDGFIVGEYGMVSHRDGSLRGVRYTADSNINPSLIYQTLVKFLSLK